MRASLIVVTSSMALSSCAPWTIAPPSSSHDLTVPVAWSSATTGHHHTISTGWLSDFNSPPLGQAVTRALAHNHDLQVAAARMREARAAAIVAGAPRLPDASLTVNSSAIDSTTASTARNHSLGLVSTWEIDLWGRLRDRHLQALADEQAAIHDFRGARLSLAATTAKAWCDLVSAHQEISLAEATLDSFEKNLRFVERNYKSIGEGEIDLQFASNNVSSARRALEARKQERDDAARNLEILLGSYPDASSSLGSKLPTISDSIPAGLPAELIDRRPDLCAARARVMASVNAANATRKAMLPALSLTASSGNPAEHFSRLLDLNSLVNTLTGRLTQTLIAGGALKADAQAAVERNRAQVHRYAQTALNAFREVESTLAADQSLARQQRFLADELAQATLAEKLANSNYIEGISPNILSLLEAQRRANNARASMIRLQNRRIQNRIDLHLALGGDFNTPQP